MLISYGRPDDEMGFVLLGTGSDFVSDDGGWAMIDGRPASPTRLQWVSGAQNTSTMLPVRTLWSTPFVPRVVGLLGLTLPDGTLIKLAFRRAGDSDFSYLEDVPQQRVVTLPDGSRCAWWLLDAGLDAVIGMEYHIFNDVNGNPDIGAQSTFDLGELWVGPAVEIPHERGWSRGVTDPSLTRRSLGSQLFAAPRRSYRTLQVRFSPADGADVMGGGLTDSEDWERIEAALSGAAPCVAIPRWAGETAAFIQRTALFGYASAAGPVQHAGGDLYGRDYSFEEVPGSVPPPPAP